MGDVNMVMKRVLRVLQNEGKRDYMEYEIGAEKYASLYAFNPRKTVLKHVQAIVVMKDY